MTATNQVQPKIIVYSLLSSFTSSHYCQSKNKSYRVKCKLNSESRSDGRIERRQALDYSWDDLEYTDTGSGARGDQEEQTFFSYGDYYDTFIDQEARILIGAQ